MCVVFESCPVPEADAFSWCHVWNGVSKDKEREVLASFEFTQTKDVQVSSFGTLALLRQFWKERQKSIIYNDVRDAVVAESEFALEGSFADASSRVRSGIWEAPKVQQKHHPVFREGKSGHVDLCRKGTC